MCPSRSSVKFPRRRVSSNGPAHIAFRSSACQRIRTHCTPGEADGTIVLLDAKGVRWLVYDRRFADRRSDMTERHFVSDAGEERGCTLAQNEEGDVSPTALSDQLARSNVIN